MGGDERKIIMMNNINITTSFTYASIAHASEYPEHFNEYGLIIIWHNPYYKNGETQLNRWVYPITAEGFQLASKDAKYINEKIKREVEETSFMRKKVMYN